ncbi:MAG: radical SAM protein [PVC group bacterium]|nr:radical SAM protein [PVC group bacterium]
MMIPWRNFRRFGQKVLKQPGYAFAVAAKRIKAYLAYARSDGRSSMPEAITLFLTHRCNLRCKMCGQWGESGVTKTMADALVKEELAFDELKKMIDDVSVFKPSLTLFGGEPLLYSQCIPLIEYIKKNKMHCLMISNGSMLKNFAEKLVDAGLDELNLSLDGDQQLHDQIRGMPELFEKITSGLKLMNQYKKQKGKNKPLINLQCTITKYNYHHLEKLTEVAKEVGANSLTYHNLIFVGDDLLKKQEAYDQMLKCSSKEWEGFVIEPEIDPEQLYKKIQYVLSKKYDFNVDFYPNLSLQGLKEYYQNPSYLPSEYPGRCLSPWVVSYVFPDGEVRPCLNCSYSFGNVKNSSFSRIWNNEDARLYRTTLKKNKIFPVCIRCTELYRY